MSPSLISVLAARFGRRATRAERRDFLRQSLATSAGLLLSSRAVTSFGSQMPNGKRIVVIGGGLSGLACAHELLSVGYNVTVLEARNRTGGRVLSANARNGREFVKGRNVELGAELIGSNHLAWVNYAEKFNLKLIDVTSDEESEPPVIIEGRKLSGDEARNLWEGLDEALNMLNKLAAPVLEDEPWMTSDAEKLDRTSVQEWIDSLEVPPLVKLALWINQTSDNGQDAHRQSLLGQLAAVKGGGLERYWTESEVYRCQGGNDLLALKLAEAVGMDRIFTKLAVSSVARSGNVMHVQTVDGRVFECDDVILTAPPKTWHKIEFSPNLPKQMNPQTGFNAKYFAVVKDRYWEKHDPKLSQYAISDGILNMTWDGTDNQGPVEAGGACLVGFAGGSSCQRALQMDRKTREQAFAQAFEKFFPGYKQNFVKSFYMDWPNEPWAGASYSFPATSQVTTVGPLMAQPHMDGGLHLAGEHTCYKFVGYMEGALQSGLRVAKMLAARDSAAEK